MSILDFYTQIQRSTNSVPGIMLLIILSLLVGLAGFALTAGVVIGLGATRRHGYGSGLAGGLVLGGIVAGWTIPSAIQHRDAIVSLIGQNCVAYIAAARHNNIPTPPAPMLHMDRVLAVAIAASCRATGIISTTDLRAAMRSETDNGVIARAGG